MKSNQKNQAKQPYDCMVKLLLIGNSGVGKSCIFLQFSENKFVNNTFTTIGVDHKTKYIQHDDKNIKLEVWDTAGQDRFKTITTSYYRGAHGIIIVYDITNRPSFEHVRIWLSEIQKNAGQKVIRILVGNKCDLENRRQVSYKEGLDLATSLNIPFFQASAKSAANIEQIFNTAISCIVSSQNFSWKPEEPRVKIELNNNTKKGYCC